MSMNEFLSAVAQFFGYILPVVGVIALVYLALLFKKLIETLKAVDKTLTIVDSQVQKLDQLSQMYQKRSMMRIRKFVKWRFQHLRVL